VDNVAGKIQEIGEMKIFKLEKEALDMISSELDRVHSTIRESNNPEIHRMMQHNLSQLYCVIVPTVIAHIPEPPKYKGGLFI
jgi:hypothetical protein